MNKKAQIRMGLMMGAAMSFTLSLIGMLSSGQFTVPGFLLNVAISFVISFVLGLIVPVKKISNSLVEKLGLEKGSLGARMADTLVSDLAMSPVMTFIMVGVAYLQARSHGAPVVFGQMYLKALGISLVGAYIMIFLVSPVFEKIAFGKK